MQNKVGRLFSPLERGRLVFAIIEGPADMKGGGAELDLDELVTKNVLSSVLFLHSGFRETLVQTWGAIGQIKCLERCINTEAALSNANNIVCVALWALLALIFLLYLSTVNNEQWDLPVGIVLLSCLAAAAGLGMLIQPLDTVRDYFGERIAFYFGWLEFYCRYLWLLSFFSFAIVMLVGFRAARTAADDGSDGTGGGGYDPEAARVWVDLAYCLVIALWTTAFSEGWKRQNAVLAHVWDMQGFDAEEDPRPEYLKAFYSGRWRQRDRKMKRLMGGGASSSDSVASSASAAASETSMTRKAKLKAARAKMLDTKRRLKQKAHEAKQAGRGAALQSLRKLFCSCWKAVTPRGEMQTRRGFFTADRRFIEVNPSAYPDLREEKVFPGRLRLQAVLCAVPSLVFFFVLMLTGTLSITVCDPPPPPQQQLLWTEALPLPLLISSSSSGRRPSSSVAPRFPVPSSAPFCLAHSWFALCLVAGEGLLIPPAHSACSFRLLIPPALSACSLPPAHPACSLLACSFRLLTPCLLIPPAPVRFGLRPTHEYRSSRCSSVWTLSLSRIPSSSQPSGRPPLCSC